MTLETKHFVIEELKASDEDGTRTIEGLGSVFGNTDSYGEIVMPGAFAESIAKRKPAMLWQHRSDMPIGVWDEVEETKRGLRLKGRILTTQAGNDAYLLAKAGALTGLSIGFTTIRDERDPKKGVRKLLEVELYEVSLVTFPANEKAQITNVKSLEGVPFEELHEHKRMVEAALRDAGASDQMAAYVASLIPKPASRDAGGEAAKLTHLLNQFKA